jgi:hypothetical protein
MINIKELNGAKLKKNVPLDRVMKRWHNHNNSGGNFGINLYPNAEQYVYGGTSKAYELTGYHDKEGNIYSLRMSFLYSGNGAVLISKENYQGYTYDNLISTLKKVIWSK